MHVNIFHGTAAVALIAFAVVTRLLPHQANFTAAAAVTLVAAGYLGWRWGMLVGLAGMVVSNFIIGGYALPVMLSVYGSFVVMAWLGARIRRHGAVRWERVVLASLGGSTLFYLVTNYAVWQFTPLYPTTGAGLLSSYAAALPFFRNTLVGDLVFASVMFGAVEAVRARRSLRKPVLAPLPLARQ